MKYYRLDRNFIDNEGHVQTKTIREYRSLDAASHDYYGYTIMANKDEWFEIFEVTERVITL